MPDDAPKPRSLSQLVVFVVVLIAAVLVLRFVFSFAFSMLKWVAIGGLIVAAIWWFTRDSGSKSA